jgi:methyl-accepting chemotaxis protein
MQGAVVMVLGLLTLFGALAYVGLRQTKEANAQALVETTLIIKHVGAAQSGLGLAARSELEVRAGDGDAAKATQSWNEAIAGVRSASESLSKLANEDIRDMAGSTLTALKAYEEASKAGTGDAKSARDALGAVQSAVDGMSAMSRLATTDRKAAFAALTDKLLYALLGVLGFAAVAVWPLTLMNSASIVRPIAHAKEIAHAIAEGDLSCDIHSQGQDEAADLLRALSEMQDKLRGMVSEVRQVSDSLGTAAQEIANGNHDLSARTEQTASNLQSTASSMGQLTDTVRQSADSARTANQLASSAAEVAQRGGSVVSQVVSTMEDINNSSKKIADIISVIDGIAFQTNILALNAAVEAARAGEQGRGFAVVASEVRSLAGRSADAAKEIKALIGASVDKVETGSKLVSDAGNTMNEIVASVQRVTDIIGEITAAASEQSEGIGQVNGSINQLDQMTQQNAALVEESAAAAESLKDQAGRLASVVSAFKVAAGYEASNYSSPASAPKSKPAPKVTSKPTSSKILSATRAGTVTSAARSPTSASAVTAAAASPAPAAQAPSKPVASPPPQAAAAPEASAHSDDWETF